MPNCSYTIEGGALILKAQGILAHESGRLLVQSIEEISARNTIHTVILDLGEATGRTSEALCPIIGACSVAKKKGMRFAIAHFPEALQRAFTICDLQKVIVVCASINEAIRDAQ